MGEKVRVGFGVLVVLSFMAYVLFKMGWYFYRLF